MSIPEKIRIMRGSPFLTLQGEGVYTGVPSTFLRLAGCNLRCTREGTRYFTCDTPESLGDYDHHQNEWMPVSARAEEVDIVPLARQIDVASPRHLVITGGEPTLQSASLEMLLAELFTISHRDTDRVVTLETNGTGFDEGLAEWIDLVSLSPKMQVLGKMSLAPVKAWLSYVAMRGADKQAQLKVVCTSKEDYLDALGLFGWATSLAPVTCIIQPGWPVARSFDDTIVKEMIKNPPVMGGQHVRLMVQAHKYLALP